MQGTYRTELENDGANLVVTLDAADTLRLKVSVPWSRISEAVAREIRARFAKDGIEVHFIGGHAGMRFSLTDLVDEWIGRFDPAADGSGLERDRLLDVLRECVSRVEAAAAPE